MKFQLTRLNPISGKKLLKVLEKLGFIIKRHRGSHVFLKHPDGRTTIIPLHPGEDISSGLLRKILKDIGIDREEFFKLIKK